jgi:hypothetical protein
MLTQSQRRIFVARIPVTIAQQIAQNLLSFRERKSAQIVAGNKLAGNGNSLDRSTSLNTLMTCCRVVP